MINIISSELLFYGGILIMAVALMLTIVSILIFKATNRKLQKKFEQEYGKLQ